MAKMPKITARILEINTINKKAPRHAPNKPSKLESTTETSINPIETSQNPTNTFPTKNIEFIKPIIPRTKDATAMEISYKNSVLGAYYG